MIDAVFINGTVGAGKTTTAEALAAAQGAKSVAHALVDLDQIRRMWPSPADDPFNSAVELVNLRDVIANYRRAGAVRFILAGVMEGPDDLRRYMRALGSDNLLVCRIRADLDVLAERLRFRHARDEAELEWNLHRLGELDAILDSAGIDAMVLDSTTALPGELARVIGVEAGW